MLRRFPRILLLAIAVALGCSRSGPRPTEDPTDHDSDDTAPDSSGPGDGEPRDSLLGRPDVGPGPNDAIPMADARRDARAALEVGTVDALLMDAISPIRVDASVAGPPDAAVIDAERIAMDGPRPVADAALPADAILPDAFAIDPDCPNPAPPLDSCLLGDAFARCAGDGPSRVYCPAEGVLGQCRWFEGGCPARGFTINCPDLVPCPQFECAATSFLAFGWGTQPWDLEREMNIEVMLDPALEVPAPAVECSACQLLAGAPWEGWAGECLATPGPCDAAELSVWRRQSRDANGDEFVTIEVDPAEGPPYQTLVLEFGVVGGALSSARVCIVPVTDRGGNCESSGPFCATAGQALLRVGPDGSWHASIHAELPAYRAWPTVGPLQFAGMTLDIQF